MKNIAIFVSGSGTNCENIIKYFKGSASVNTALVLANRPDCMALERARRYNVPTVVMPKDRFNDREAMENLLQQYGIDFIVLAGFLVMIPSFLVEAYRGRMVNIHPSLLPRYGGKGMYGRHVHEAVKAAGDKETGITIHWVSQECDGGAIIASFSTPLLPSDSVDDIARKVHELEMKHFPEVIRNLVAPEETVPTL